MTTEQLELVTTASGDLPTTPGAVLRLLHQATGASAEEIEELCPSGRGRLRVAVSEARARRIGTPLRLVSGAGTRGVLWEMRRPDDLAGEAETWLGIGGASSLAPGAVARALAEQSQGLLGGEDLGLALPAGDELRAAVPARLQIADRVPALLETQAGSLPVRIP